MADSTKGNRISAGQTGILLALPAMAVFGVIILYPFINSVLMSFTNKSLLSPAAAFTGPQNYAQLFGDPNFFGVLKNTVVGEHGGPGWLSRFSDWMQARRSVDRIPVGARFYAPVQTGPGAHTVSYIQWVPGLSPGGKAAWAWR